MFGTSEAMATNRVSRPDQEFGGGPGAHDGWRGDERAPAQDRVIDEVRELIGRAEGAGSNDERVAILRALLYRLDTLEQVPGDVIARIDVLARGSVDPDVLALGLRVRVRARAVRIGLSATERWDRASLDARLRARHTRKSRRLPARRIPAASLDLRYDVDWQSPLGVGGFALSFAAVERGTGRRVVIKRAHDIRSERLIHLPEPVRAGMVTEFRERFRREARALEIAREAGITGVARLVEHGELVDPFAADHAGDSRAAPYLVTERIEGRSLGYLLKVYPAGLPVAAALHWGAQLLNTLGSLHDAGLLHRDIKPANLVFETQPDTEVIDALAEDPSRVDELPNLVLIDFGAAMPFRDPRLSRLGFTPPFTDEYAPIEQLQRELAELQGPWTDVYAAGVVLLDLLAGYVSRRRCFEALRKADEAGEPLDRTVALRRLLAGQRASVVSPVLRALEPWPDDRIRAARPLARSLDDTLRAVRRGGRRR